MTDYLTASLGFGAEDSPRASYTLRVNGVERPVADAWIGESLLYVLRERLGLAGAKGGCEQGECGACSVQVDGQLTSACLVPAALAAGVEIRTVEGLADEGVPSDVQQALADSGAVQCGYCAPGLAMAVHDLLERNHHPSELEARQALCGNLCRCTGYQGALAAVRAVAESRADTAEDNDTADAAPGVGYFGEGPVDGLIEATSPVEELVALPVPALDEMLDDDAEAELPVYVDIPPQHGGYGGPRESGYPDDGGYGADPGYPDPAYGTSDYGQAPYPGGPFGGRFPGQSDGPGSRTAAGSAAEPSTAPGSLLLDAPPSEDRALDPTATGSFKLGAGLRAQSAAARRRGLEETGSLQAVPALGDDSAPAASLHLTAPLADPAHPYATGSFHMDGLPVADPSAGPAAFGGPGPETTGSFRVDEVLAEGHAAGGYAVGDVSAGPAAFGGLGPETTGSFRVDALLGEGQAAMVVDALPEAGYHYGAPPLSGEQPAPPTLDPATGVYVLPHQHGQETGS